MRAVRPVTGVYPLAIAIESPAQRQQHCKDVFDNRCGRVVCGVADDYAGGAGRSEVDIVGAGGRNADQPQVWACLDAGGSERNFVGDHHVSRLNTRRHVIRSGVAVKLPVGKAIPQLRQIEIGRVHTVEIKEHALHD